MLYGYPIFLITDFPVTSAPAFTHTVTERFLRYVVIDTQSDPSSPTCPSTDKQKNLGRMLAAELKAMGLADAHLDAHGYVYATIPATSDKRRPVICFCSHMDTSPDCSGANVSRRWSGIIAAATLRCPADPAQVIRVADYPELNNQIGNDIITTDGTTLLGADNKAGVAEIMDAAQFLLNNPQVKHGVIKILFTPDEEIGRGVDKADLNKLGADFAYTMDGETAGTIEDETFSADGATIIIDGVSTHPGFAKGKMEHAIKIAAGHRRSPAEGDLLAGDHRRPGGLSASDRHIRRAGTGDAELHRARLRRGGIERERGAAGEQRQGCAEELPALDIPDGRERAVPQHEGW